ncbi:MULTISPECIES: anthranilate synthase component II [unclassified Clostridium]|uniref:anthranilate synthase component II n=1 Tax=unclassified Clostridium TaxID=2614128 RepID=UPI0025C6A4C6|nr:aminodeoxychorismate/anthranilate synthase component II [Clostridium sp.]MDY6228460.1 aminodeoxychorismate/anthranilate synthase component II [Clostridium sp.]
MIALIDNYDSFTFNLYQYLSEFSEVKVFRNDELGVKELEELNPSGIVISPGPGKAENAGNSVEIIKAFKDKTPILGICLGHQAIAIAFGGVVKEAMNIVHGKRSKIKIKKDSIFNGVNRKFEAMRYHSLIIEKESIPEELEIIAKSLDDDEIMAIKHKELKVYGLQFHPESIYTDQGKRIIKNFVLEVCGIYD